MKSYAFLLDLVCVEKLLQSKYNNFKNTRKGKVHLVTMISTIDKNPVFQENGFLTLP